ncbi:ATP-binding protein [Desulfobulbus alkaliphilus]|uniref:ATP-binding protein n=1 Tax=Desulfobulbus alkaliphilus TaxID=869814 RepID=UPI0019654473|nr:ATP-binding protein [Desulfobulbus alkaliphilus]MBM9537441.1 hypothetical protein [Desulfobulbus alkaliphilus]
MPKKYEIKLTDFVHEIEVMLQQARPFVRDLVKGAKEGFAFQAALDVCWRLFHTIDEQARSVQLENLSGPADAMQYLLDRTRSGLFSLQPVHISLLAESYRFIEQGLDLVRVDEHDQRLAAPAAELSTAILRSVFIEHKAGFNTETASAVHIDIQEDFFRETEWLLEKVEQEFVLWDFIAMDQQRVAGLGRLLQRLRDNFSFFELREPAQVCGVLVSILDRFLKGSFFHTEYPERVFLRSIDAVRQFLFQYDTLEDCTIEGLAEHLGALQGLMRQPLGVLLIEAGLVDPLEVDQALDRQKLHREEKPLRLGEVLVDMGKVTRDQVDQILRTQSRMQISEQWTEAKTQSASAAQEQDPSLSVPQVHVCIDSQKFAQMIDLIRGVAARESVKEGAVAVLTGLLDLMESHQQEAVPAFLAHLEKVVRDLADKTHKQVRFDLEGAGFFPDPVTLALLAEPIFHLLRNAIEHGVEVAREREAFGKNKLGRLTLGALRVHDDLWLSIEDDGRGMDVKKLAAMAVARGLVGAVRIEGLSCRECIDLLVQHQEKNDRLEKSTSRPCGFVVVSRAVQRLGAAFDVWSQPGKGTRITLKIPHRC